jgi:hexulose-6-phosphate isomerase
MTQQTSNGNRSTRRDFLAQSAALGAAMTLSASLSTSSHAADAPAPAGKKRPWKKAVMIGMVKGGTILEKFQILKEAGFDGVELNAPMQHKIEEVKAAMKETGILCEGVVDAMHWKVHLSDPDPSRRALAVETLKGALRECKEWGGTSVLLVPGVVSKAASYADVYKRSQEEIAKAIPVAAETGVKIAVENVWNKFHLSPLEAARYIDEINSPHVGWHFDIGNILNFGWPEHWIPVLGKRILKLHIKEFSRKKAEQGAYKGFDVELLEGDNDWPAIMKALDDVGYNTWACIEMGGGGLDRMKVLSSQLDRILAS